MAGSSPINRFLCLIRTWWCLTVEKHSIYQRLSLKMYMQMNQNFVKTVYRRFINLSNLQVIYWNKKYIITLVTTAAY